MSIRLYVGNLPKELERQELEAVFEGQAETISTKVITDRKTGKCRGFGFVTVKTDEQADELIEKFNGFVLKESSIKIEKALPRAKGGQEDGSGAPDGGNGNAPSNSGGGKRKGSNKSSRRGGSSSSDNGPVQPDPRWASELEKLKQMLAAQNN